MANKQNIHKHAYVMLIDDVELDNFINEKLIRSYNFSKHVYVSTSAASALEFLNNIAIASAEFPEAYPAVIFVDINMPIVDGFQFISSFRKIIENQDKKPKLVILTSSAFSGDRDKTTGISKDITFLNKPLSKEMLESL